MIDRNKLERIRSQLEDMRAPIDAQFKRYRDRTEAAERRRRDAVASAPDYAHFTVAQLLTFAPEALEAVGIDMQALRAAEREMVWAAEAKASHEASRVEIQGLATLVANLETYAGIRS